MMYIKEASKSQGSYTPSFSIPVTLNVEQSSALTAMSPASVDSMDTFDQSAPARAASRSNSSTPNSINIATASSRIRGLSPLISEVPVALEAAPPTRALRSTVTRSASTSAASAAQVKDPAPAPRVTASTKTGVSAAKAKSSKEPIGQEKLSFTPFTQETPLDDELEEEATQDMSASAVLQRNAQSAAMKKEFQGAESSGYVSDSEISTSSSEGEDENSNGESESDSEQKGKPEEEGETQEPAEDSRLMTQKSPEEKPSKACTAPAGEVPSVAPKTVASPVPSSSEASSSSSSDEEEEEEEEEDDKPSESAVDPPDAATQEKEGSGSDSDSSSSSSGSSSSGSSSSSSRSGSSSSGSSSSRSGSDSESESDDEDTKAKAAPVTATPAPLAAAASVLPTEKSTGPTAGKKPQAKKSVTVMTQSSSSSSSSSSESESEEIPSAEDALQVRNSSL
jgi:uncharacterized membrane protein YgcG